VSGFDIDAAIRKIPDHPRAGILFYDLMPLFQDPRGLDACVTRMAEWARPRGVDAVLGAEARGFILGGALARELGVGFVAARKPGKLPAAVERQEYDLEYGTDVLEVHVDSIGATGGSARAKCELVERLGGVVAGVAFVVELTFLPGRARLGPYDVLSLQTYDTESVPVTGERGQA
jgi:adenine phosphoribosyltransferase